MKIYTLQPNENWVVDRFVEEWNKNNPEIVTFNPIEADIIWLAAGWCWNHLPQSLLHVKTVVCSVHHIDKDKFQKSQQQEFLFRDQFVNWYHVPCAQTAAAVAELTKKPIFIQPFWVNQRLWHPLNKKQSRLEMNLPADKYLIGSFQRDTEGSDLISPKMAKGPDIFCDVVIDIAKRKNVHVVLGGWRRQYIISRLIDAKIPYTYFEMPTFEKLNVLYNTLDLYVVGSRCEGGPQAIFECAASQTPIISTPVGYATQILGEFDLGGAIYKIEHEGQHLAGLRAAIRNINVDSNYENVMNLFMRQGMDSFIRFFKRI